MNNQINYGYCNICKNKLNSPTDYQFHKGKKVCLGCYESIVIGTKKANLQKKELEQYICKLFGFSEIPAEYSRQIDKFVKDYKFTYKGIEGSLYYFYELLENDIANDVVLGIVPSVYNKSKKYFKESSEIQEINKDFDFTNETQVVKIKKPKGKIPSKTDIKGWD